MRRLRMIRLALISVLILGGLVVIARQIMVRWPDQRYMNSYLHRVPPAFLAEGRWVNTDHPLDLASLRGKVVVIDFWATWCAPCLTAIPELKIAQRTSEFILAGVSADQDRAQLERVIEESGLTWPIIP